jgi:PAS domain-containing protein
MLCEARTSREDQTRVMEKPSMVTSEGMEKRTADVKPARSTGPLYGEALPEGSDRYRRLVNDLPLLICTFLPSGEITFVNQNYCRYFHQAFSDLVGSNFLSLIPRRTDNV